MIGSLRTGIGAGVLADAVLAGTGPTRLRGKLLRPVGQCLRTPRQGSEFSSERSLWSWFETGRIPVPPATVKPPDGVDDELGFVVHRPQVRPVHQLGGRNNAVNGVIEPTSGVQYRERLVDQRV